MRLTGEAARKYLEENPNARFTDNRTGQVYGAQQDSGGMGVLSNILKSVSKPLRQGAGIAEEFGLTIKDLASMFGGGSVDPYTRQNEGYKYALLDEEESEQLARDPLKTGLKSGAGVMAYAVPGGGGKAATTVAGRIGTAATRGAGAGALGGFGASEEGEELESILKGAGIGGAIGGGIQAGGEALKALQKAGLDKKLQQASDDLKVTAIKKKVGVAPTARQGKYGLVKDVANTADDFGVKIKGPEDVAALSDEIFSRYGGLADEYAQAFDDAGNAIDINQIKQPLIDQLKKTKTPELQKPIQKVLNSIDEAAGGSRTIGAKDLLSLRREWGNLGNWNQFTPTNERMAAAVWEDAYSVANDVLEESLKKAGYTQFRDVNKLLKTGVEAQNWAQRAEAYRRGSPVWNDMTQDALAIGAAGLGGGPGGAAGVIGSKYLQANAEDIASKGLGGLADILQGGQPVAQGIGSVARPVAKAVQRVGPAAAGQLAGSVQQQPIQQDITQTQPQTRGLAEDEMQALRFYLANAVLQGDISGSDVDAIMSLLGVGGEGEGRLGTAISELERLYGVGTPESLSMGDRSVGIGGLINKAGATGKKMFDQDFANRKAAYDQQRALAVGIINQAREAGVLNEGEYEVLIQNMPDEYTTEQVASDWFENVRRLLGGYSGSQGNPEADLMNYLGL